MSTEPVGRWTAHAPREQIIRRPSESAPGKSAEDALEFVRFCYRRRRIGWPELYDEMCAVAARGAFRGLGYAELADLGICFSLYGLPPLAALTERVVGEERARHEPGDAAVPMMLVQAPARG